VKAPNELAVVAGKIRKRLEVKLSAANLEYAFHHAPWNENEEKEGRRIYRVTDRVEFLNDLVNELNHEDEDGSTPLTRLLDECMESLVERGSLGVEDIDEARAERKAAKKV
jgi:hypothetical protein